MMYISLNTLALIYLHSHKGRDARWHLFHILQPCGLRGDIFMRRLWFPYHLRQIINFMGLYVNTPENPVIGFVGIDVVFVFVPWVLKWYLY